MAIPETLQTLVELSPVGIALYAVWMLPDWLRKWIDLRTAWTASHQQAHGESGES